MAGGTKRWRRRRRRQWWGAQKISSGSAQLYRNYWWVIKVPSREMVEKNRVRAKEEKGGEGVKCGIVHIPPTKIPVTAATKEVT